VTRFPHGAAGKFLSTVLQTSNCVDHWSNVVQHQKNINRFVEETTLAYCDRVFPTDHSQHILNEPMVPYCTDLYSTTFPRGNNVSKKEYWAQNDHRLELCNQQGLIANIIFNKPDLPLFCKEAKVLTVLATSEQEQNWIHKAIWSKHFIVNEKQIIYTPSSLQHCHLSAVPKLVEYKPEFQFPISQRDEVYNKYVINNPTVGFYKSQDYFADEQGIINRFFNLNKLFDSSVFLQEIESIFEEFDLGYFNKVLVKKIYNLWWSRQNCV
jgi:hypothetical protein